MGLNKHGYAWEMGHQTSLLPLYRWGCLGVMPMLLAQERNLISSPLAQSPEFKSNWDVSKVKNQPDNFFPCISLAFKIRVGSPPQSGKLSYVPNKIVLYNPTVINPML